MTASAAPHHTSSFRRTLAHPAVGGAIGVILLVAVWWVIASWPGSGEIVPAPPVVIRDIVLHAGSYYAENIGATLARAAWGYLWGNLAAIVLAAVVLLIPKIEEIVTQLGVISQCVPITAIGPILLLVLGSTTSVVLLAAQLVFFTTLVGAILGMRSARQQTLDMVTAFGGSAFTRLRKVRMIAAIPSLVTALKIAVPGAILGAVVGEYLGATDTGIGVALQAAQRSANPDRVWAMSILAGLVALVGYGLVGLIGRLAMPWAWPKGDRG